ncbi:unnamed protein product [Citrullus colocynthis]|uniref:Uncharacterized protein n=1 Tax=Citrullus colocynthis TaxID=252529 RepID=A0ABP0XK88_9ROSI
MLISIFLDFLPQSHANASPANSFSFFSPSAAAARRLAGTPPLPPRLLFLLLSLSLYLLQVTQARHPSVLLRPHACPLTSFAASRRCGPLQSSPARSISQSLAVEAFFGGLTNSR